MQAAGADIGIMAFVLQFAPQEFVTIPKHGTIQYHPSLLPRYRGPSSINWPIIKGETETGLTIFRPPDGLAEGAVILQKKTPIGPDDTLGTIYFNRLFPMGVAAMLEAADLVLAGKHNQTIQDESQATYGGWCRSPPKLRSTGPSLSTMPQPNPEDVTQPQVPGRHSVAKSCRSSTPARPSSVGLQTYRAS